MLMSDEFHVKLPCVDALDRFNRIRQRRWVSKRSLANPRPKKRRDSYLLALGRMWPTILRAYDDFKDRKPIVEYCVREKVVYAYPALSYLSDLTESTREEAKQQYREAAATGRFMVFVRDSKKRVYRSYVFPVK